MGPRAYSLFVQILKGPQKETCAAGISGTGSGAGTFTGMSLDTPLCGSLRFASPARPPGKFSRKFMQPELGALTHGPVCEARDKPRKR